MDDKNNEFPQYRKLSNGLRFYKISSDKFFEEVQLMGTKSFFYKHEVSQYPEILLLRDMLACEAPYEKVALSEWEKLVV
jgi:hypothetical protein